MSRAQQKLLKELRAVIARYSSEPYDPQIVLEILSRALRRSEGRSRSLSVVREASCPPARPNEVLRELRRRAGLTLAELEALTGIAQPNLSAAELGKRSIGPAIARKLAKALGVDHRVFL